MTKFHIFLESGARIELTPAMEQKIYSTIFRLEEKEVVAKPVKIKKSKRAGSWIRWTPEEDAVIANMVNGENTTSSNIRVAKAQLPGRTSQSIRVRVYWLRKKLGLAQAPTEVPVTQA